MKKHRIKLGDKIELIECCFDSKGCALLGIPCDGVVFICMFDFKKKLSIDCSQCVTTDLNRTKSGVPILIVNVHSMINRTELSRKMNIISNQNQLDRIEYRRSPSSDNTFDFSDHIWDFVVSHELGQEKEYLV